MFNCHVFVSFVEEALSDKVSVLTAKVPPFLSHLHQFFLKGAGETPLSSSVWLPPSFWQFFF